MALDKLCHLELLITAASIKKKKPNQRDYRTTKQQGRETYWRWCFFYRHSTYRDLYQF